jgi:hypothetical protein
MTHTPQPTSGQLEAKIIRACKRHTGTCSLQCKYRVVEDLGQIASFDPVQPQTVLMYGTVQPTFRERLSAWLREITHPGGS